MTRDHHAVVYFRSSDQVKRVNPFNIHLKSFELDGQPLQARPKL